MTEVKQRQCGVWYNIVYIVNIPYTEENRCICSLNLMVNTVSGSEKSTSVDLLSYIEMYQSSCAAEVSCCPPVLNSPKSNYRVRLCLNTASLTYVPLFFLSSLFCSLIFVCYDSLCSNAVPSYFQPSIPRPNCLSLFFLSSFIFLFGFFLSLSNHTL